MKKINYFLRVVVIAGACFGAYKSYKAYNLNLCGADLMLSENVLALSENHSSLKHICKNYVYKLVREHLYYVYQTNDKGESVRVGEYVNFKVDTRWWQTCAETTNPKYNINCYNDICVTLDCARANGYEPEQPAAELTGIKYIEL